MLTHCLKGVRRNYIVPFFNPLIHISYELPYQAYERKLKYTKKKEKKMKKNIYPIDNSLVTVFPMQVAPPSTRAETIGDVREAASCVLAQSG